MRVCVIGAFGFLGTALTRHLCREHDVTAVGHAPGSALPLPEGVHAFHCDVRGLTSAGLRGYDAIVHLAGGGQSGGSVGDVEMALRDNLDSARHVAMAAPPSCRLILASSIYVYGLGDRPFVESDPCAPDTLYGCMKLLAEQVWCKRGGIALRFSHLYGAVEGVTWRDGVTERLARAAATGGRFTRRGSGLQRLDLLHVEDARDVIGLALNATRPGPLNIGSGSPVTLGDLIGTFGKEAPSLRTDCEAAPDQPDRALDIGVAQMSGWYPRVSLSNGVRGLVDAHRAGRQAA